MPKRDFNSLTEIFAYIEKEAKKTIQEDDTNVKNFVVSTYIESIEDNVYAAYEPLHYQRQMTHGGLSDPNLFRVEPTPDGVAISSSRKGVDGDGNQVDVMEVIEGFKPWAVEDVWGYGFTTPRNAVQPAIDRLKQNQRTLNWAFSLDMQNRGFSVE